MAAQRRNPLQEELLQLAADAGQPSTLDLTAPLSSDAAPAADIYRVASGRDLLMRHFEDGTVVFNDDSWDTHYLNESAAVVLEYIVDAPRSAADVTALMAELLTPDEAPAAAEHARTVLDELVALHLISRVPADAAAADR